MISQRLAYLDELRAIAIIAVVLYHCGFLECGYLGVDAFLVITGYLSSKSLLDGKYSYHQFLTNRVLRLLPVILIAGIIVIAIGWFTMLPDDYENLCESVVATNLFGNNVLSAITTGDYWNIANEYKPLMHTWYVGLLMQFYLVYLAIFPIYKKDDKVPQKTLLVCISTLGVLSLLWYFGSTNEAHRFYYLPARFFEFAVGGIVALAYTPSHERLFHPVFSYLCYALFVALLFVGYEIIPSYVRLPLVVALCAVLLLSSDTLNKASTHFRVLAKLGIASYSIYIWHQILLAFYRYVIGEPFTLWTFILYVVAVSIISWLSYQLIEQGVNRVYILRKGRVFIGLIAVWLLLTGFAGYVYIRGGIVRDVPELGLTVKDGHRRMNVEYTERGFKYDKPFVSDKKEHWFVIGNSFGRDFVNVILESDIADKVEVSFTDDFSKTSNQDRFAKADRVFVSTRGLSKRLVSAVEVESWANGLAPDKIVIVGDKSFGVNNGRVYAKRYSPDYFEQRVEPLGGTLFLERNNHFREFYGERFIDLMSMVTDEEGLVQIFTPDHHFISADGKHLTKYGAKFFAERINWGKILK